jgi:hypothetical protein
MLVPSGIATIRTPPPPCAARIGRRRAKTRPRPGCAHPHEAARCPAGNRVATTRTIAVRIAAFKPFPNTVGAFKPSPQLLGHRSARRPCAGVRIDPVIGIFAAASLTDSRRSQRMTARLPSFAGGVGRRRHGLRDMVPQDSLRRCAPASHAPLSAP